MINTTDYTTKEFTPAPSIHFSQPQKRMLVPRAQKTMDVTINSGDLKFLSDFLKASAFYIEELEQQVGEDFIDFWQTREHALRIVTDAMVQKVETEGAFS